MSCCAPHFEQTIEIDISRYLGGWVNKGTENTQSQINCKESP